MRTRPNRHRRLLYILKALVTGVLIVCLIADPLAFALPLEPAPRAKTTVQIPEKLGRVEESSQGTSGKTILYIQDAHDSLEAQENIAALIHHFVEKDGVKTVYEEGYEGPVPTDAYFGFIKDPGFRKKVSYFLLDKLRIHAAEYAHINAKTPFKLIGADSIKLHLENIEQYRKTARAQKRMITDLEMLSRELETLRNQNFPKEFKDWIKLKERYERNELPLLDYLKRSLALTAPAKTDQFPHLNLLLAAETTRNETLINRVKAADTKNLFLEVDSLEDAVGEHFLKEAKDQKAFHYYKVIRLLKRLGEMRITSAEFEAAKTLLRAFDTQDFAGFIAEELHKPVLLPRRWEKAIQRAMEFYELAEARNQALAQSLEAFMDNPDEKTAVLVFGGFHKDGIREILHRKEISYSIITPRISSEDPAHQNYYKQLMGVGHHEFEIPLAVKTGVPTEGVYETSFGRAEIQAVYGGLLEIKGNPANWMARVEDYVGSGGQPSMENRLPLPAKAETARRSENREISPERAEEFVDRVAELYWAAAIPMVPDESPIRILESLKGAGDPPAEFSKDVQEWVRDAKAEFSRDIIPHLKIHRAPSYSDLLFTPEGEALIILGDSMVGKSSTATALQGYDFSLGGEADSDYVVLEFPGYAVAASGRFLEKIRARAWHTDNPNPDKRMVKVENYEPTAGFIRHVVVLEHDRANGKTKYFNITHKPNLFNFMTVPKLQSEHSVEDPVQYLTVRHSLTTSDEYKKHVKALASQIRMYRSETRETYLKNHDLRLGTAYGEFEIKKQVFDGIFLIYAGHDVYKVWVEPDINKVLFKKMKMSENVPGGQPDAVLDFDEVFRVGRSQGEFQSPENDRMSALHFGFKVSVNADGRYLLTVRDIGNQGQGSVNGTRVVWHEEVEGTEPPSPSAAEIYFWQFAKELDQFLGLKQLLKPFDGYRLAAVAVYLLRSLGEMEAESQRDQFDLEGAVQKKYNAPLQKVRDFLEEYHQALEDARGALKSYRAGKKMSIFARMQKDVFLAEDQSGKKWLLKKPAFRKKEALAVWEASLVEHFNQGGIRSGGMVRNDRGRYVTMYKRQPYILSEYDERAVPVLGKAEGDFLIQAAENLASMHDLAKDLELPGRSYTPREMAPRMLIYNAKTAVRRLRKHYKGLHQWGGPHSGAENYFLEHFKELNPHFEKTQRALPPEIVKALPQTIVHGEYHHANAFYFEQAHPDARIYDLANAFIVDYQPDGSALRLEKVETFLTAYQAKTAFPLTSQELTLLPEIYRAWYLRLILTTLDRYPDTNDRFLSEQFSNLALLDSLDWPGLAERLRLVRSESRPESVTPQSGILQVMEEEGSRFVKLMSRSPEAERKKRTALLLESASGLLTNTKSVPRFQISGNAVLLTLSIIYLPLVAGFAAAIAAWGIKALGFAVSPFHFFKTVSLLVWGILMYHVVAFFTPASVLSGEYYRGQVRLFLQGDIPSKILSRDPETISYLLHEWTHQLVFRDSQTAAAVQMLRRYELETAQNDLKTPEAFAEKMNNEKRPGGFRHVARLLWWGGETPQKYSDHFMRGYNAARRALDASQDSGLDGIRNAVENHFSDYKGFRKIQMLLALPYGFFHENYLASVRLGGIAAALSDITGRPEAGWDLLRSVGEGQDPVIAFQRVRSEWRQDRKIYRNLEELRRQGIDLDDFEKKNLKMRMESSAAGNKHRIIINILMLTFAAWTLGFQLPLMFWLSVQIHELGHYAAAAMVKWQGWLAGHPTLKRISFGLFLHEVRPFSYSESSLSDKQRLFIALAGPLANLLAAAGSAIALLVFIPEHPQLLLAFMKFHLFGFVFNLFSADGRMVKMAWISNQMLNRAREVFPELGIYLVKFSLNSKVHYIFSEKGIYALYHLDEDEAPVEKDFSYDASSLLPGMPVWLSMKGVLVKKGNDPVVFDFKWSQFALYKIEEPPPVLVKGTPLENKTSRSESRPKDRGTIFYESVQKFRVDEAEFFVLLGDILKPLAGKTKITRRELLETLVSRQEEIFAFQRRLRETANIMAVYNDYDPGLMMFRSLNVIDSPDCGLCRESSEAVLSGIKANHLEGALKSREVEIKDGFSLLHRYVALETAEGPAAVDIAAGQIFFDSQGLIRVETLEDYRRLLSARIFGGMNPDKEKVKARVPAVNAEFEQLRENSFRSQPEEKEQPAAAESAGDLEKWAAARRGNLFFRDLLGFIFQERRDLKAIDLGNEYPQEPNFVRVLVQRFSEFIRTAHAFTLKGWITPVLYEVETARSTEVPAYRQLKQWTSSSEAEADQAFKEQYDLVTINAPSGKVISYLTEAKHLLKPQGAILLRFHVQNLRDGRIWLSSQAARFGWQLTELPSPLEGYPDSRDVSNSEPVFVLRPLRSETREENEPLSKSTELLSQVILRPEGYDLTQDQPLLDQLVGKPLGKTNKTGFVSWAVKPQTRYYWMPIPFKKEGYEVTITKAMAKPEYIELEVIAVRGDSKITRRFQIGNLFKTIHRPGVELKVREISDKLGIRLVVQQLNKPVDYDWRLAEKEISQLTGLMIGKTNLNGLLNFTPARNYQYSWAALHPGERDYEGTITSVKTKASFFEFNVLWTKEGAQPIQKSYQVGGRLREVRPVRRKGEDAKGPELRMLEISRDLGIREIADLLQRPAGHNWLKDRRRIEGLLHKRVGETDKGGRFGFSPAPYFMYEFNPLGLKEEGDGYEGIIVAARARKNFFEFEILWIKQGKPPVRKLYQVGGLRKVIYPDKKVANEVQPREIFIISRHLGLTELSELVNKPVDYDWNQDAQRIEDLAGKRIGPTLSLGGVAFNPVPNHIYDWRPLGIAREGYEGTITDGRSSGSFFEFGVSWEKKKGRKTFYKTRRYQVGGVLKKLRPLKKRFPVQRVLKISRRLGAEDLGDLLTYKPDTDWETPVNRARVERMAGKYLGEIITDGTLHITPYSKYASYAWAVLGKKEKGYKAVIISAEVTGGLPRLTVELTKKEETLRHVFYVSRNSKNLLGNQYEKGNKKQTLLLLRLDSLKEISERSGIAAEKAPFFGSEKTRREPGEEGLLGSFTQALSTLEENDRQIAFQLAEGIADPEISELLGVTTEQIAQVRAKLAAALKAWDLNDESGPEKRAEARQENFGNERWTASEVEVFRRKLEAAAGEELPGLQREIRDFQSRLFSFWRDKKRTQETEQSLQALSDLVSVTERKIKQTQNQRPVRVTYSPEFLRALPELERMNPGIQKKIEKVLTVSFSDLKKGEDYDGISGGRSVLLKLYNPVLIDGKRVAVIKVKGVLFDTGQWIVYDPVAVMRGAGYVMPDGPIQPQDSHFAEDGTFAPINKSTYYQGRQFLKDSENEARFSREAALKDLDVPFSIGSAEFTSEISPAGEKMGAVILGLTEMERENFRTTGQTIMDLGVQHLEGIKRFINTGRANEDYQDYEEAVIGILAQQGATLKWFHRKGFFHDNFHLGNSAYYKKGSSILMQIQDLERAKAWEGMTRAQAVGYLVWDLRQSMRAIGRLRQVRGTIYGQLPIPFEQIFLAGYFSAVDPAFIPEMTNEEFDAILAESYTTPMDQIDHPLIYLLRASFQQELHSLRSEARDQEADIRKTITDPEAANRHYDTFDANGISREKSLMISFAHFSPNLRKEIIRRLKSFTAPPAKIISIGSGRGTLERDLIGVGYKVTAVDLNDNNIRAARSLGVPVIQADAHHLPFEDKTFDLVLFSESVGNMRLEEVLREAARILKPGGSLLLTTYPPHNSYDALRVHYYRYSMDEIREALIKTGWIKPKIEEAPISRFEKSPLGPDQNIYLVQAQLPNQLVQIPSMNAIESILRQTAGSLLKKSRKDPGPALAAVIHQQLTAGLLFDAPFIIRSFQGAGISINRGEANHLVKQIENPQSSRSEVRTATKKIPSAFTGFENKRIFIDFEDLRKFSDEQIKEVAAASDSGNRNVQVLIYHLDPTDVLGKFFLSKRSIRLKAESLSFAEMARKYTAGFQGDIVHLSKTGKVKADTLKRELQGRAEVRRFYALSYQDESAGTLGVGLRDLNDGKLRKASEADKLTKPVYMGVDGQGKLFIADPEQAGMNFFQEIYSRTYAFARAA